MLQLGGAPLRDRARSSPVFLHASIYFVDARCTGCCAELSTGLISLLILLEGCIESARLLSVGRGGGGAIR